MNIKKKKDEEETNKSSLQTNFPSSDLANFSTTEIHDLITQCLKLNAENKISHKNAFKLKMIDCLFYTLRHDNPEIKLNLNKASACLDASGKIYALRVDKLHSDLMKVTGGTGEKRKNSESENEANPDPNNNNKNQRKKKKKTNTTTEVDSLKGNPESFNPISNINSQVEVQTSDMLLQVCLIHHTNKGIALNLHNYIVLDKVQSKKSSLKKLLVPMVEDLSNSQISPSFDAFKFNSSSEFEDELNNKKNNTIEDHFALNDSACSNNFFQNEENTSHINLNETMQEEKNDIEDFKSIIENNPNNYEYSYMKPNHSIEWKGPSHWKIKFCKTFQEKEEKISKELKKFRLSFCKSSRKKAQEKFVKMSKLIKLCDWEDNLLTPFDNIFESENLFHFFTKQVSINQSLCEKVTDENCRDNLLIDENSNVSDFVQNNSCEDNEIGNSFENTLQLNFTDDSFVLDNSEAFVGNNLVLAPKSLKKTTIAYSLRAKKINMKLLKQYIEKFLKIQSNKTVNFSNIYLELSKTLPQSNAKSLTPSLAFVSLLHVVNENKLSVNNHSEFCDITIQSPNKNDNIM